MSKPAAYARAARAANTARGARAGAGAAKPAAAPRGQHMADFKPSAEQAAILEFLQTPGSGNLFINAGAGCGKTTTCAWLLGHLEGSKFMGVFNKEMRPEIERKVDVDVMVRTIHGLGWIPVSKRGKIQMNNFRIWDGLKAGRGEAHVSERYAFYDNVVQLASKAKGQLVHTVAAGADGIGLGDVADRFGIDFNGERDEGLALVERILAAQIADRQYDCFDYDDMVWLCVVQNLPVPRFANVVIDESQDLSPVQIAFVAMIIAAGGRIIAVGDRRQAIYAWRGADEHAVDRIIEAFSMSERPLMTTFRCAKSIVREAQKLVPEFTAGENNPEGVVRTIDTGDMLDQVKPGDFVLSRTNAPLVSGCMRALARGIRAIVRGRDIGGQLAKMVTKTKAVTLVQLEERLTQWLTREVERLSKKIPVSEQAIETAQDKVATIRAIADSEGVKTVADVIARLTALFDLTKRDSAETEAADKLADMTRVVFSSTHRAKGQERETVFLLRDTFMRARRGRNGEMIPPSLEEANLLYVAITRAKSELVYAHGTFADHRNALREVEAA